MDLILISDLVKKLSSIIIYKDENAINEFIDDPLSLDLSHLDQILHINSLLSGGGKSNKSKNQGAEVGNKGNNVVNQNNEVKKNNVGNGNNNTKANENTNTNNTDGDENANSAEEESNTNSDKLDEMSDELGGVEDIEDEENRLYILFKFVLRLILYPILFICLVLFPYAYVTVKSYQKVRKLYKKNVLSM